MRGARDVTWNERTPLQRHVIRTYATASIINCIPIKNPPTDTRPINHSARNYTSDNYNNDKNNKIVRGAGGGG